MPAERWISEDEAVRRLRPYADAQRVRAAIRMGVLGGRPMPPPRGWAVPLEIVEEMVFLAIHGIEIGDDDHPAE